MDAPDEPRHIDTLLLLGPPASGKSVIRRFLERAIADGAADIPMGPMVQIDDFPYVYVMWRIWQATLDLPCGPLFFEPQGELFADAGEWGSMIQLLNEDHAAAQTVRRPGIGSPGEWVMQRLEEARQRAGMVPPFQGLAAGQRAAIASAIEDAATPLAAGWSARTRPPGSTMVVEFARGGPEGAAPPLVPPWGYDTALSQLSAEILREAVILYVWVTPEESRRRNLERSRPGAFSSLHHDVPDRVLRAYYGVDDMPWLMEHSQQPGTITVEAHGSTFHVPIVRFDNRRERASLRDSGDHEASPEQLEALLAELGGAMSQLVRSTQVVSPEGPPPAS